MSVNEATKDEHSPSSQKPRWGADHKLAHFIIVLSVTSRDKLRCKTLSINEATKEEAEGFFLPIVDIGTAGSLFTALIDKMNPMKSLPLIINNYNSGELSFFSEN